MWLEKVYAGMPPEERFSQRNRAITARYARWYLDHPRLFKWAGMAAHASRQVGIAIVTAEMMRAPDRVGSGNPLVWMHLMASGMFMLQDLEELRKGNNGIFRDIAWAHAAYLEGGISEIEANAEGTDRGLLLEGFRSIDQGAKMAASGDAGEESERLVWSGNVALLRHEQTVVLQPVFDRLSPGGRILASFGSELDFSGCTPSDQSCVASFPSHCGYLETLSGLKSIADPVQRWQWVESRVVPAWMAADRLMQADPARQRWLQEMAEDEPGLLQRFSEFTGSLLPGS